MIVPQPIEAWLTDLVATDAVEEDMRSHGVERGFPIIGALVGQACYTLSRAIHARNVFEMGSGFGYSTWWFARAVGENGHVVHTDHSEKNTSAAKAWLTRAGLADRVRFETGDAIDVLSREKGPFDVIFVDVDKGDYPRCWQIARKRVRVGGLVLADNALWQGKVATTTDHDAATEGVRAYTKAATNDMDFASFVMPIRDGVCVSLRLR